MTNACYVSNRSQRFSLVFLVAFHIACHEVSDLALAISFTTPVIPDSHLRLQIIFSMSGNLQLLSLELATNIHRSNGKITFQSFFILMTVQSFFFASSYSACVKVPTFVSGNF